MPKKSIVIFQYGEAVNCNEVDLGLVVKNKPVIQFEIKTNCLSQSVYCAIGQLMLHSNDMGKNVKKVFVAPSDIDPLLIDDLCKLDIETVIFRWRKNIPVFDDRAINQLSSIIKIAS